VNTTTISKPINAELAWLLREHGPISAKNLARLHSKSESRMREILKQHQTEIQCKKDTAGVNVFWLPAEVTEEPTEEPLEEAQAIAEEQGLVTQPSTTPEDACPLCGSTADQPQAGPEGSFLGAARTCSTCGKTYNAFSREEVTMPAKADKAKRTPLNPQYKIRLKTDAAEAAQGKLIFDREARQWVLTKKGKDPIRMTAKEFSVETAETITAKLA